MKLREGARKRAPGNSQVRFFTGVALMAASFLVYPAYSLILVFLPFSGKVKVGAVIAASLASWAIFSAGLFLAGREGYDWLKGRWRR